MVVQLVNNKLVLIVQSGGVAGPIYGPFDDEKAKQILFKILETGYKYSDGPVELTDELRKSISSDGYYESDDGSGVYIMTSEHLDEDDIDGDLQADADELTEQQRRKNGL
jgi:hypothetical protein